MHLFKGHAGDVKGVLSEARGVRDANGEKHREGHSRVGTIDPTRTHLNYSLTSGQPKEPIHTANELKEYIKSLGVTRKIRSDAVLFDSIVIDLPADYEGDQREFFMAAYKALRHICCDDKDERILQAPVHLDEKTPHMHFAFIPILEKDGKVKLASKELTTRTFMRQLHPKVEQYMNERLSKPVKLYDPELVARRKDAKAHGDRSLDSVGIEEFKAIKEKESAYKDLSRQTANKQMEFSLLDTKINTAKADLSDLETKWAELSQRIQKAEIKAKSSEEKAKQIKGIIKADIDKMDLSADELIKESANLSPELQKQLMFFKEQLLEQKKGAYKSLIQKRLHIDLEEDIER